MTRILFSSAAQRDVADAKEIWNAGLNRGYVYRHQIQAGMCSGSRLYQPRGMETPRQVHHSMMISECAVRIAESTRASALKIPDLPPLGASFYHTHAVGNAKKRRHVDRFVSQDDLEIPGQPQPLRIRPDLVFALSQREISRLYFLEADRGSENPQQIAEKQVAYHHYRTYAANREEPEQRLWHRYGSVRDFRVLVVTTDERRPTMSEKDGP